MQTINKNQTYLALAIVFLAALSRFLPHPSNFTPFIAMAIFSGHYFANRLNAMAVTLSALFLTDLIVNNVVYAAYNGGKFVLFYEGALWVYGAIAVVALLSNGFLKKVMPQNLLGASLGASILFFLVSNFGAWISTDMYPKTAAGLGLCYTAAVPFFSNSIVGDLFYTGVLFGLYHLASTNLVFRSEK